MSLSSRSSRLTAGTFASSCALVAFLTACAESSRSPPGGPVMDTINGVVLVRNGPEGLWQEGDEWAIREDFRIGAADGPREILFGGNLASVSLGPHGQIFVLDFQAEEIRVFDGKGAFVRNIGRPGQGPGELARPMALGWDSAERLWVPNAFNGRHTVFATLTKPRRFCWFGKNRSMTASANCRVQIPPTSVCPVRESTRT